MKSDMRDHAPGDIIRAAERGVGVDASMMEFTGSTGYATCRMYQAQFPGADLVIRVRSPKHRAYIGMSAGLMAANPALAQVLKYGDGSPFSVNTITLSSKVIRFFHMLPKEVAQVVPLLESLKKPYPEPSNTDPFALLRVQEVEELAGHKLEWTTYPDLAALAAPGRVTAVKLGDCMPSVLLLEDGRVAVVTHTDHPPVSLHSWVMGWTASARSYEAGPMNGELMTVNHILGRGERTSYRMVANMEEWGLVKAMIRSAITEASGMFDQLAVMKGVNPSIMN